MHGVLCRIYKHETDQDGQRRLIIWISQTERMLQVHGKLQICFGREKKGNLFPKR